MQPPGADVVVVRHGEIGIKSQHVTAKMERQLRENLAVMLADRGVDGEIDHRRLRLLPHTDDPKGATAATADTFGVVSASPATRVEATMGAICEGLAADCGAAGIVTGESVGQKSSQTTANLAVTSAAVDLPVHRPLLTVDKTEITQRAADIGTFEESTVTAGCDRLAPDYPETRARLADIEAREPADLREQAQVVADRIAVAATGDSETA